MVFDIDNTLVKHHGTRMDAFNEYAFISLLNGFKRTNCCILSNATYERVEELRECFGKPYGIEIIRAEIRKPHPEALKKALDYIGLTQTPNKAAMIGDRRLTDIAGGNMVGMYTIKVRPVSLLSEPHGITMMRYFEEHMAH